MLKDMSLEELWELFPVTFTNSTDKFKTIYSEEAKEYENLKEGSITNIDRTGICIQQEKVILLRQLQKQQKRNIKTDIKLIKINKENVYKKCY